MFSSKFFLNFPLLSFKLFALLQHFLLISLYLLCHTQVTGGTRQPLLLNLDFQEVSFYSFIQFLFLSVMISGFEFRCVLLGTYIDYYSLTNRTGQFC